MPPSGQSLLTDITREELRELWRAFITDSRHRPVNAKGDPFPIPRCEICGGSRESPSGKRRCTSCRGSGAGQAPTYGDHIESVARDYPRGDKAVRVSYGAVDEFQPRLAANLVWNTTTTLIVAREVVNEFIPETEKQRVHEEHHTEILLDVEPLAIPQEVLGEEIRDLRKHHLYRLVRLRGLVRKTQAVRPRMEVAYYECTWERHVNRLTQDFFHLREPSQCHEQGCKCTEFHLCEDRSQYVDSQKLEIQEFPEELPAGAQPQRIIFYAEGALAARVQPGDRVAINGILRPRAQFQGRLRRAEFDIYLYAASIDEHDSEGDVAEPSPEELEKIQTLARLTDIHERIRNSISPTIHGLNAEKDAIAMLLFGGVAKKLPDGTRIRGDIHMLMMGDPGMAKSQLLRSVSRLAPRGVMATGKSSSAAGLTAAAVRDEFGEGRWTLEAGILVLATGGIACIDELDKMTEEDRSAMHEAMEQQTITVAKAGINAVLHARCSILAAANPRYSRFEDTLPLAKQVKLPATLLSRFDIFFIIRDRPVKGRDEELAEHMLKSHYIGEILADETKSVKSHESAERETTPPIEAHLLKLFIAYARRHVRPTLTPEARFLIRNHYTKLRRKYHRGDDQDINPLPITPRQLESLIRMAEATARMHLSTTVEPEHAQQAIDMMNHFINVTLEGDIDALSGLNAEQRQRTMNKEASTDVRTIIKRLVKDEMPDGIDTEEIVERLKAHGINRHKAEKVIRELSNSGEIIEYNFRWII